SGRISILDVREPAELADGAVEGSINIPLGQLTSRSGELDRNKLVVVHCKGGYRSSIGASLLRRCGMLDIANLAGGFDAWKSAGLSGPAFK
ncbi:MAG: rhodanese-like domain-containing protein, partial [Bryobacterales bacterium]|nr:rhodanese-like domain-containing protein [Bryobacterales bacterium]